MVETVMKQNGEFGGYALCFLALITLVSPRRLLVATGYKYILVGGGYSNLARAPTDVVSSQVFQKKTNQRESQDDTVVHSTFQERSAIACEVCVSISTDCLRLQASSCSGFEVAKFLLGFEPGCFLICQGWADDFEKALGDVSNPHLILTSLEPHLILTQSSPNTHPILT